MARRTRKPIEVFSLSFLDCICCGFGAVILLFVLTTGRGLNATEGKLASASEQMKALEEAIEGEKLGLQQDEQALQAALDLASQNREKAETSRKLREQVRARQHALAELETQLQTLQAEAAAQGGSEAIPKLEQTQPQHLTEFSLRGDRILILVEASGGMLGESVPEALSWLKRPAADRRESPKWKRTVQAIKTLIAYLPEEASYQVCFYAQEARLAWAPEKPNVWLGVKDAAARLKVFQAVEQWDPAGGANLEAGLLLARQLRADNLILLTDGLPTLSNAYMTTGPVSETHRLIMFKAAQQALIRNLPLQIILFPMRGDPGAAPWYWQLAQQSGGSLIVPARDWPSPQQ